SWRGTVTLNRNSMADRIYIKDLGTKVGQKVSVSAWLDVRRDHGKLIFLVLRDGTGTVQAVANGKDADVFEVASCLRPEWCVRIEGEIKVRPEKMKNDEPNGDIELSIENIVVLSRAQELPFDKDAELNLDTYFDHLPFALRRQRARDIFHVQATILQTFRDSLVSWGFTEFQAPVIIPQTAEGGAEVFAVDYFGHKAFLSQSPQFYKQILVGVYERVFAVNKTLRAEPSVTTRHLTEVTTLDAEFGFIDSWEELMEMAEYLIKSIFSRVEKDCADILKLYNVTVPQIAKNIPRVKLREAQEIIFKRTGRDARNEPDLSPEDEREICRWSSDVHQSDLVFVSHYPLSKRPFYTFEDPDDPGYTLSLDLSGRGVEWLTGGQRVNNLAELEERAKGRGVDIAKSELYLQAFRFGMPPEGGFSFGSERITQGILNLANIREASLFPRDMERVDVRLKKV
ncbi:MAG: aspartate--tRNA(Asn) ligase, partial [Candidatus Colwellbacteria bacterium]|nr:aspartate--tRNA(Asn) ligase [Candidatus Colwellbacteria bacterium]